MSARFLTAEVIDSKPHTNYPFDADLILGVTTRGLKRPARTVGRIIAKYVLQVHLITLHEMNPGF